MTGTKAKEWRILSQRENDTESLARWMGMSSIAAQVLWNRGITDPDTARSFLSPALNDLHDPDLYPEMQQAAVRICEAAERKEPIVIYGDYDVDGITATAILVRCLRLLGAEAHYYIPSRLEEGYGLNAEAISALAEGGARLLVTVDCGINAVREIGLARELCLDVIVTDHHEPDAELPVDTCLIDPKLPGCPYPFRELSGAGVAFKLAWAIGKRLSPGKRVSPRFKEFLLDVVTLAALGTIADVVPLCGENRVIARFGLLGLESSNAPGLRALCEAASLSEPPFSARDVAFRIAPRLNAAGRMGCAMRCVKLLTTDSMEEARAIARDLDTENTRRQKVQQRILKQAQEMLATEDNLDSMGAIILAREGWHAGVIGIVASRLVDEYCRPVVLLTLEGDQAHGSARSIEPVNLFAALQECTGRLMAFGGHAMAAGLHLKREELPAFVEEFEAVVTRDMAGKRPAPMLDVDAEVQLAEITTPLVEELACLAPFGAANHEPVLAVHGATAPGEVRRMGSGGRHLSFFAQQDGVSLRAVAFGMGDAVDQLAACDVFSLAFVPNINRWRGRERIELDVQDLKLGPRQDTAACRGV